MTLSHKIAKAFRPQSYSSRTARRYLQDAARLLNIWRKPSVWKRVEQGNRELTVEKLLGKIDRAELARIQAKYANGQESFWTKYLDVENWLAKNIKYARRFDLIVNPPADVLDLGCGMGCFLFVCQQLGSRCLGVDLDTDPIFNDLIKLFGVERIGLRIEPFVKLPDFGRKFDLITAFMICFNNFDTPEIWKAPQWEFLINDLAGRLKENGTLLFSLNKQLDGVLYPEDIHQLFLRRGASIEGKEVLFTKSGLDATAQGSVLTSD